MIRYATVCSGVEAMSLAVQGMDWKPVFFSEIEPFPCALLKYRFPDVTNIGDMTKIDGGKYHGTIDVFAGGTPCQAFSVAGKRQGLDDPRGMLSIHFAKLAYECGSRWVVWENVAGVLSQDDGKAFASFLSCLAGYSVRVPRDGWKNFGVITGGSNTYGLAYRVLDAQYCRVDGLPYAVPQRRRRVWVVGYLGDWRRAVEVLFEQSSLYGNPPTRIRTKKETSNGIKGSAGVAGKTVSGKDVFPTLLSNCGDKQWLGNQEAFSGDYFISCASKQQSLNIGDNVAMPVMANDYKEPQVVCYENHANDSRVSESGDLSPTITSRCGTGGGNLPLVKINTVGRHNEVSATSTVRRLTPTECERLMGFPDYWAKIPWNGKASDKCPDAPRYKACGNSWAVNCARWVMQRIDIIENRLSIG